jgi:hypothetical protein
MLEVVSLRLTEFLDENKTILTLTVLTLRIQVSTGQDRESQVSISPQAGWAFTFCKAEKVNKTALCAFEGVWRANTHSFVCMLFPPEADAIPTLAR